MWQPIHNNYSLTQQLLLNTTTKAALNCTPSLMFCQGQFWLDLFEEICFKEWHCQEGFQAMPWGRSGDVLSIGHTVNGQTLKPQPQRCHSGYSKQVVKWVEPAPLAETTDRGYSDSKREVWAFIFTWDCKQHFPPGTKSSDSQLLQILICESEECLKIDLWVKK